MDGRSINGLSKCVLQRDDYNCGIHAIVNAKNIYYGWDMTQMIEEFTDDDLRDAYFRECRLLVAYAISSRCKTHLVNPLL